MGKKKEKRKGGGRDVTQLLEYSVRGGGPKKKKRKKGIGFNRATTNFIPEGSGEGEEGKHKSMSPFRTWAARGGGNKKNGKKKRRSAQRSPDSTSLA